MAAGMGMTQALRSTGVKCEGRHWEAARRRAWQGESFLASCTSAGIGRRRETKRGGAMAGGTKALAAVAGTTVTTESSAAAAGRGGRHAAKAARRLRGRLRLVAFV